MDLVHAGYDFIASDPTHLTVHVGDAVKGLCDVVESWVFMMSSC